MSKEYYATNKERIREYQRAHYLKKRVAWLLNNPKPPPMTREEQKRRLAANTARWRAAHPEGVERANALYKVRLENDTGFRARKNALRRRSYELNHDQEIGKGRLYREQDRERLREGYRRYDQENAAKRQAYKDSHKEEQRAYRAAYHRLHPEVARMAWMRRDALKRNAFVEDVSREAIIIRDKRRCGICGRTVAQKDVSFDHIIPLSLGGGHSMKNVRLTHLRCNKSRGAHPKKLAAQLRMV